MTAEFDKFYVVTVYTPNAKDDLSRLALRFEHWDPAFLAYCKQLEKTKPVVFCGDLNVAHTELDLANPKPNRGKRASPTKNARAFKIWSTRASWIPSDCLRREMGIIRGGVILQIRGRATSGGESTMCWSQPGCGAPWKAAEIHPAVMGSDHCPVSITLDA